MPDDRMSREAMLLKVKAAERKAVEREDAARRKAREILSSAKREADAIVNESENQGREYMREQMERLRAQGDAVRQKRMEAARQEGQELIRTVEARMPGVTEWVYDRFRGDYDVED